MGDYLHADAGAGGEHKPPFPIEAEAPIVAAFTDTNRAEWINVSATAIATSALSALADAGWRLLYPKDFPGLCPRCSNVVDDGTMHRPFNGNQMFACEIIRVADHFGSRDGSDV